MSGDRVTLGATGQGPRLTLVVEASGRVDMARLQAALRELGLTLERVLDGDRTAQRVVGAGGAGGVREPDPR